MRARACASLRPTAGRFASGPAGEVRFAQKIGSLRVASSGGQKASRLEAHSLGLRMVVSFKSWRPGTEWWTTGRHVPKRTHWGRSERLGGLPNPAVVRFGREGRTKSEALPRFFQWTLEAFTPCCLWWFGVFRFTHMRDPDTSSHKTGSCLVCEWMFWWAPLTSMESPWIAPRRT